MTGAALRALGVDETVDGKTEAEWHELARERGWNTRLCEQPDEPRCAAAAVVAQTFGQVTVLHCWHHALKDLPF